VSKGRSDRGFTLVEVLIATFIIALGVMGLLALFAGAARQQQTATQTALAGVVASGAEAILEQKLGMLQRPTDADGRPLDEKLRSGVWYPIPLEKNPLDEDNPALVLNPITDSPDCSGTRFLVVKARSETLYSQSDTNLLALPGIAGFKNGSPTDALEMIRDFSHRRVLADSLRVRVTVRNAAGQAIVLSYFRKAPPTPPELNYAADQPNSSRFVFPLNGEPSHAGPSGIDPDYLIVDTRDPTRVGPNETALASIYEMEIGAVRENKATQYIESVEAEEYEWKTERIVSLRDRVRKDVSYSLLYSQDESGGRMAVVSYQMTPDSGSAVFVPPERCSQDFSQSSREKNPPLREAELELRYDKVALAYYMTVKGDNDKFRWAIAPGQLLIVAGVENSPSGRIEDMGSENAVRVARQERTERGELRAYLDDSPRRRGVSLLKPDSEGPQDVRVFGVNDVVTSTKDQSRWRLKPLDVRFISMAERR